MRAATLAFSAALLLGTAVRAAEMPSLVNTADVVRSGSLITLPGLKIHGGDSKYIEATGKVSLTKGILEFIAVETEGRDYESLLTLDCKPSALQFALLLIGCEPAAKTNTPAGDWKGEPVRLEIEWQRDGKTTRVPVEQLLVDRHTGKPAGELTWIFSGSYFKLNPVTSREVFLADEEQAFISLWWQTSTPVNLSRDFGNPYRGDDQGFEVNAKVCPPKATPVTLILRKRVQ